MNHSKALIFGSIASVAGAALWAAIAYYANFEIAWLAWGIGFVVGFACVKGAGNGNLTIGVMASILTILPILLGRYATVDLVVNNQFGDAELVIQEAIDRLDDETLISYLADEIIAGQVAEGKEIAWPEGIDPNTATAKEEYPAEIWAIAKTQWDSLPPDAKKEFQEAVEVNIRENIGANLGEIQNDIRQEGFLHSFEIIDFLFFGLAIYTAFSVGNSNEFEGGEGEEEEKVA